MDFGGEPGPETGDLGDLPDVRASQALHAPEAPKQRRAAHGADPRKVVQHGLADPPRAQVGVEGVREPVRLVP